MRPWKDGGSVRIGRASSNNKHSSTRGGVAVDLALGAVPFEDRSVRRASSWMWAENHHLVTCSADDLVVHKAFAGRHLDWGDLERILVRQHNKLNLPQIRSELKPLLEIKGELDALDKFEQMLATVERRLKSSP